MKFHNIRINMKYYYDVLMKRKLHNKTSREFDYNYYIDKNPDVRESNVDPYVHYIKYGWKEGRNPRADFDTFGYLRNNIDVVIANINPFVHYVHWGRAEGRLTYPSAENSSYNITKLSLIEAVRVVQDDIIRKDVENHNKFMIIVIPEHNEMSGGIYSFFSIARAAYQLRHEHDYKILIMTRPNRMGETYIRQRNFRNYEDVLRFDQIVRFAKAETVYLHIPEYAASHFVESLDESTLKFLRNVKKLYINVLNQKIEIMPDRYALEGVRALANELTQSVAHHAYFGQEYADKYGTPLLLLPAYTDLSPYEAVPPEEKDNLIIYSPDDADWKDTVIKKLRKNLPDYELREIRGIDFDTFMDLASRCRFAISFGEGFDGYVAQPCYQGGVGFAVYNEEYFPTDEMLRLKNIFISKDDIEDNIVSTIKELDSDLDLYRNVNKEMMSIYNNLYSRTDYLKRIRMLINREFEIQPMEFISRDGPIRL
jgi:hypothetical protein